MFDIFEQVKIPPLMPRSRHNPATDIPASFCLSITRIRLSVYRDFFIATPPCQRCQMIAFFLSVMGFGCFINTYLVKLIVYGMLLWLIESKSVINGGITYPGNLNFTTSTSQIDTTTGLSSRQTTRLSSRQTTSLSSRPTTSLSSRPAGEILKPAVPDLSRWSRWQP